MRALRGACTLFVALLPALGLAACGGSGSSTSSPTAQGRPSTAATASTPTTPAPATPTGSTKPTPPRKSAQSRPIAKSAGRAAPFLVREGDNSIPTYGAESSAAQRSSATASLHAYLMARASGSWSTACSYLGSTVRSQLAGLAADSPGQHTGCARSYAKLSAPTPAAQRANPLTAALAAFRVKGEKAFALFYGPHHQKFMMPMEREASTWKVTQIAPIAYPPGIPTPPTG